MTGYVTLSVSVTKIEHDSNEVPQEKIELGFRRQAEKQINTPDCTHRPDNPYERCFEFSGNICRSFTQDNKTNTDRGKGDQRSGIGQCRDFIKAEKSGNGRSEERRVGKEGKSRESPSH